MGHKQPRVTANEGLQHFCYHHKMCKSLKVHLAVHGQRSNSFLQESNQFNSPNRGNQSDLCTSLMFGFGQPQVTSGLHPLSHLQCEYNCWQFELKQQGRAMHSTTSPDSKSTWLWSNPGRLMDSEYARSNFEPLQYYSGMHKLKSWF